MPDDVLHTIVSVSGKIIRITLRRWTHVTKAHDYMSDNLDKVIQTLGEPDHVLEAKNGEFLALRAYSSTNITRKTSVVVYRDMPDGFLITVFFTSKPQKIERRGKTIWLRSPQN